ncbi:MAG: DUF1854 domain-containing protein [Akkermansiaceae bacterium]|nr:DUF1854 domain-containing protein [Armatimonadota bacterium]
MSETTPVIETDSDLILLTPASARLFRSAPESATVRLTVENDPSLSPDRSYRQVRIARAFPFANPDKYIGLRDGADKDIGTFVTLDGIDKESRQIITEELERRYFLPVWKRTVRILDKYGIVEWEMETDRGIRTYLLRNIKDSVQHLSFNRVLVTDPDGNRFEIADTSILDPRSYDVMAKAL